MLGNQQGKVRVARLACRVLVAVAVYGNDTVRVFAHHASLGIHAEGAHLVLELLRPIHDLAFVQLVCEVGPQLGWQLNAHANVYPVGLGGNLELPADLLHPLAPTPANRHHARRARIFLVFGIHAISAALQELQMLNWREEEEFHPPAQPLVEVFQHHMVYVGSKVAHRGVEQLEPVLHTERFYGSACRGVELGALATMHEVDLVYVMHELKRLLASQIFV